MAGYDEFQGTLPYASELFGVYQPLLGWKSKLTMVQIDKLVGVSAAAVFNRMLVDPHDWSATVRHRFGPPDPWKATRVGVYVRDEVDKIARRTGGLPDLEQWEAILDEVTLTRVIEAQGMPDGGVGGPTVAEPRVTMARTSVSGEDEMIVASGLRWLCTHAPETLGKLVAPERSRTLDALGAFVDPLASFDPETQLAVLSPVGIVHLYREYFFELDTFPGPPVGHVWLSPGGTVELVEVNTRRSLTERLTETLTETTTRTEQALTERDEIADAVKEENQRNVKFGMNTSWGSNWLVAHAEASANFGFETTSKRASETTHKHMREQSEKLSSEIRRSFKTTFRSVEEVTDVSSRRYVLQNTGNELQNYELRRKMRRVAVQVQHIGMQLCWQAFVDEPGRNLGIAELVHVASPEDLDPGVAAPEGPVLPQAKTSEMTARFAYQVGVKPDGTFSHRDDGDDFKLQEIDGQLYCKSDDAYIVFRRTYSADPPAAGYELAGVTEVSVNPRVLAAVRYEITGLGSFDIWLENVNFDGNPAIDFALKLTWRPGIELVNAATVAYGAKMAEYTEARRRKAHEDYVTAVRERVEAVSKTPWRPASELREEERTVIFRALMRQVMQLGTAEPPHVVSELLRALFDIDKMLYFVAPEWWVPRQHSAQQVTSSADTSGDTHVLATDDRIGWGGVGAKDRDNYLITEKSAPAPLGSSLGWLLQLDGDNHRNAFLNSPWVKAIVPIRLGREEAAFEWLQQAAVEGSDGLDAEYLGPEPELHGETIRTALQRLATDLRGASTGPEQPLATEKVFETGFDPLEGGFRATGTPYEVFDQWVEVLPTDQVIALEWKPPGEP